jgi:hypothetical protein
MSSQNTSNTSSSSSGSSGNTGSGGYSVTSSGTNDQVFPYSFPTFMLWY